MLRGCPLAIIGNELAEKDDPIRQDLSLVFEALRTRIAVFLRKQKKKGHLSQTAEEEQLSEFCVAVVQGAMLIGKVRRESRSVESLFEEVTAHLKQFRLGLKT